MTAFVTSNDIGAGLQIIGGKVTATPVSQTLPSVLGWVNVNADGSVAASAGVGIAASRTNVGRYSLTPPAGAQTALVSVIETNNRDDIEAMKQDFLANTVQIHEGDNGGTAGTFRDRAFTVVWYGTKPEVTGLA